MPHSLYDRKPTASPRTASDDTSSRIIGSRPTMSTVNSTSAMLHWKMKACVTVRPTRRMRPSPSRRATTIWVPTPNPQANMMTVR